MKDAEAVRETDHRLYSKFYAKYLRDYKRGNKGAFSHKDYNEIVIVKDTKIYSPYRYYLVLFTGIIYWLYLPEV